MVVQRNDDDAPVNHIVFDEHVGGVPGSKFGRKEGVNPAHNTPKEQGIIGPAPTKQQQENAQEPAESAEVQLQVVHGIPKALIDQVDVLSNPNGHKEAAPKFFKHS